MPKVRLAACFYHAPTFFDNKLASDCRPSCSSTRPGTAKSWLLVSLLAGTCRHLSHNFGHMHRGVVLQQADCLPGHFLKASPRAQSGMGDDGRNPEASRFANDFHRSSSPSRMEGGAIVVVSLGLGQGVNKFPLYITIHRIHVKNTQDRPRMIRAKQ